MQQQLFLPGCRPYQAPGLGPAAEEPWACRLGSRAGPAAAAGRLQAGDTENVRLPEEASEAGGTVPSGLSLSSQLTEFGAEDFAMPFSRLCIPGSSQPPPAQFFASPLAAQP